MQVHSEDEHKNYPSLFGSLLSVVGQWEVEG